VGSEKRESEKLGNRETLISGKEETGSDKVERRNRAAEKSDTGNAMGGIATQPAQVWKA
jgi:hypothetical protein